VIRVARVLASAESGGPPTATRVCAWCGRALDAGAERLGGRLRCASCGVATTDPWPSASELDEAYAGWYRPSSGRFSGIGDAVLRLTRGRLAQRLDQIAPAGPILDVGAGDGALLDALAGRGRRAVGLERESTRPDVRDGDLGTIDGRWAAIVFWHSLEHLASPGDDLERAADLLEPSGVLVIAVPNADSLQAHVFGERWLALDLPRHLVHIPASALLERVRSVGLTVERVSYWRGGQVLFGWLHGLVGSLPGRPDLYDAIRRPDARRKRLTGSSRLLTLAAALALSPFAVLCAAAELAARRGGTVYVEARRG
jgi:SAM-dependent methyltransferase